MFTPRRFSLLLTLLSLLLFVVNAGATSRLEATAAGVHTNEPTPGPVVAPGEKTTAGRVDSLGSDDPRASLERYARSQGGAVSAYDIASHFSTGGPSITFGAESVFNAAATNNISVVALDATHFVTVYRDEGNSNHGTAIVGRVNGKTITYGAESVFNAAETLEIFVAALDEVRFVIGYRDGALHGTVRVGEIDGTSITYGPESVFNAAVTNGIAVAALDARRFVVGYRDWGNSRHGTARVGQISGTSITYGPEKVFNADVTGQISVAALSSTRFVIGYWNREFAFPAPGRAIVGQVSGTSITFGAYKVFSELNANFISIAALDATRFVVAYRQKDNFPGPGKARVGTVSGTSITYGPESVFNAGNSSQISVAVFDATRFVVAYRDCITVCSGEDAKAVLGTVSGTSITYDAKTVFNAARTFEISAAVLDGTHFVVGYRDEPDSRKGTAIVGQVGPDLSVVQSNSGTPVGVGQPWQWRLQVSNTGTAPATFAAGDVLLSDQLPQTGVSLSSFTIDNQTGLTGGGTIKCAINFYLLTCWASSGPVTLAPGTGSFRVSVTATGTATGSYTNPTGGTCAVDPNNAVPEGDETNNACNANTVEVTLPDLSVVQSNSGTPVAVDEPWQWRLQVSNLGSVDATFAKDKVLLVDYLPTPGVTYDATVTVDNQTGITGTISCALEGVELRCTASGGPVTIGANTGTFRATVTATALAAGSYTNPTAGGTCSVDPGGNVSETDETNNACNEDTVVAIEVPDLSVVKSNTGSPVTVGQSWQWHLQVSNTGSGDATFASGDKLLIDHLPTTNVSYDATITVDNQTGITGTISCSTAGAGLLICTASGGVVTLAKYSGSFRVVVTATASAAGSYTNPTGGLCAVDPEGKVSETDETNNACIPNTVDVVQGAPELTVVKSNSGTPVAVGQSWQWHLQASNLGSVDATFASGDKLLVDYLPTTDVGFPQGPPSVSYDATVTVDNQTGITGTISCAIDNAANVLTCTASGGPVTIGATTGSFRATVTATATISGTFANPTGGICAVDPDDNVSEVNETNNACNTDTVVASYHPELSVVKSNSGTPVVVGQSWQWYLQVSTLGSLGATFPKDAVLLIDHLPTTGVSYDATVTVDNQTGITGTISCAINASNVLRCTASGGPVTVGGNTGSFRAVVTATASAAGSYTNPTGGICAVDPDGNVPESNEDNNQCNTDTVEVQGAPDLSVVTSNSGSPVAVGQSWQWYLVVTNTGGADAVFNAIDTQILTDALPTTGVTYSATVTVDNQTGITGTIGCSLSDGTPLLTCRPTQSGGGAVTLATTGSFRAVVTATASAAGSYTNGQSTCAVDPSDVVSESDETNNQCNTDTVVVGASGVDLGVTITESADPVLAGSGTGNLVYTVTVTNHGTAGATGVVLDGVPTRPTGVTVDGLVVSAGTRSGRTWTLGSLAAGASETFTATMTVDASAAGGTDVVGLMMAVTSLDQTDAHAANDAASVATSIQVTGIDLGVTITESADPVQAGSGAGNLVYTVTVTNHGTDEAIDVVLDGVPTRPAGVTVDGIVVSAGTRSGRTWTLGSLAAGASETFTATMTVDASASSGTDVVGLMMGLTSLAPDQSDAHTVNNEATEMTSITAAAAQARLTEDVQSLSATLDVPAEFALSSNYPNPFNPETTIPFALPEASEVLIAVYDVTGRRVALLVSGPMQAGHHEVAFRADHLASGLYLVRMQAGSFSQVRRMTLVK